MSGETCELPGCNRPVREVRPQRSGDVVRVCGEPHVYGVDGFDTAALETPKGDEA